MKKYIFLILYLFQHYFLLGQPRYEVGFLPVYNFSNKDYSSMPQNFDICQDDRGIIYIANDGGVILEYDGKNWQYIEVGDHPVRSLAKGPNGRIYVGSEGDLGYLQSDSKGQFEFVSLLEKLREEDRDFDKIVNIYAIGENIIFQTSRKLIIWNGATAITVDTNGKIQQSAVINNTFYASVLDIGLVRLEKDVLRIIDDKEIFHYKIVGLAALGQNHILIATSNDGLYYKKISEDSIHEFTIDCKAYLISKGIKNIYRLPKDHFSIGTKYGGVVIIDKFGSTKYIINKEGGLQDNYIHRQLYTNEGSLWLATENGVSKVDINSPVTHFNEKLGIVGEVQAISRFNGELYVGSKKSLFVLKQNEYSCEFVKHEIITQSIWDMATIELETDTLLVLAMNDGVYQIDRKNKVTKLLECYPWCIYQSKRNPNRLFIGLDEKGGVVSLLYKNGKWKQEEVIGEISATVRKIEEDKDGFLWLATVDQSIMRITPLDENLISNVTRFDSLNCVPSGMSYVYQTKNELFIATPKGLFEINDQNLLFKSSEKLRDVPVRDYTIHRIREDFDNNVWLVAYLNEIINLKEKGRYIVGYMNRNSDNEYSYHSEPFFDVSKEVIHAVYNESNGITWLGGAAGVYKYNPNIQKDFNYKFKPYIRWVTIEGDSAVFFGGFSSPDGMLVMEQDKSKIPSLPYRNNSVTLKYSAITVENDQEIRFSYFLEGVDKGWSDWKLNSEKDYTNLYEGGYVFKLKAITSSGNISEIAEFQFRISPPWYRTILAYITYFVITILLIYVIVRLNIKRLRAQNFRLEKVIEERTIEIRNKNIELEKLSLVASETANAITIYDSEFGIEYRNTAFYRLYKEILEEEILDIGRNIKEIGVSEVLDIFESCVYQKKPMVFTSEKIGRGRVKYWIQTTLTPVLGKSNEVVKLVSIDSDITEIKQAEQKILEQAGELEKLSIVARETDNSVIIADKYGNVEWVNDGFTRLTGYTLTEYKRKKGSNLVDASSNHKFKEYLDLCTESKESVTYTTQMERRTGEEIWVQTNLTPIIDVNGDVIKFIALDSDVTKIKKAEEEISQLYGIAVQRKEEIEKQHDLIALQKQEMTDSIHYAQRIQEAVLPDADYANEILGDHFILFKPRDIVSGDFYYATKVNRYTVVTVADCTGHGVPGAFMSMLGVSFLNDIIRKKEVSQANHVLNELREMIIDSLKQKGVTGEQKDGMDMSIVVMEEGSRQIQYAGANNSIWFIRKRNADDLSLYEKSELAIEEIRADKMPVAIYVKMDSFINHQLDLEKGDIFYLFSDGYPDQFGGPKGKKFKYRPFKKLLVENFHLSMQEQMSILDKTIEEWKSYPDEVNGNKEFEQVDDICVIGIRMS